MNDVGSFDFKNHDLKYLRELFWKALQSLGNRPFP